jgi:tRNA-uridine 2-sulfurtransferase
MNQVEHNPNTTVVAMSGGVDSSVVAGLLHRQGTPVVGLTMQLWNQRRLPQLAGDGPAQHRCCSIDDVYDARRVAEHCGFPFYVVNFERQFEDAVVRPFVEDYLGGRTPIPCTHCNNSVKFDQLLLTAQQIGAARLATGHYARIRRNPATGRYELLRARDASKDQSYFLFGLTQDQLARSVFPLGDLTKSEVRTLAHEMKLPVAEKPESQEICFVPSGDYAQFIEGYLAEQGTEQPEDSGETVTTSGEVVGRHAGLHHYTVGQRRGLGIAAGRPMYVVNIDSAANRLVVGDDAELHRDTCEVERVNWISIARLVEPIQVMARIRHKHEPAAAIVEPAGNGRSDCAVRLRFHAPQRAITPGQAAVFYQDDLVVGGGWIR